MGARHPLPYAFAKAHTLLLEDDGSQLVLWAPETVGLPALSEVLRIYDVDSLERESASTLTNRIGLIGRPRVNSGAYGRARISDF